MSDAVRMDKWLWAVRLFKTRSQAADACRAGRVVIQGQAVKPARIVRIGDTISVIQGDQVRTVSVRSMLDRRVSAAGVAQYLEDLTPPAEAGRERPPRLRPLFERPKGAGRPTKRDRRVLDELTSERW